MRRFLSSPGKRNHNRVAKEQEESARSSDSEEEIDILICFSDDSEEDTNHDGEGNAGELEHLNEVANSPTDKAPEGMDTILNNESASAETAPLSQTTASSLLSDDDTPESSSYQLQSDGKDIYFSQSALETSQAENPDKDITMNDIFPQQKSQDLRANSTKLSYNEFVDQARWMVEAIHANEEALASLSGWKMAKAETAAMGESFFLEHEPIHRMLSLDERTSESQPENALSDIPISLADDSIATDPDMAVTSIPTSNQQSRFLPSTWYLSIVYSDTWQCPVLYFRIENTQDGSLVTDRQLILEWLQHVHHQNPSTAVDSTTSQDLHEFISWDEHPLLQMPSFFLHPCQTKTRLENMMHAAHDVANDTILPSASSGVEMRGHQPAQPSLYMLSWISLMLPAVGVSISAKEWLVLHAGRAKTSSALPPNTTTNALVSRSTRDGDSDEQSCHSDNTPPIANVSRKNPSTRKLSSNLSSSDRRSEDSKLPQHVFKPVDQKSPVTPFQAQRVVMNPWDLRNQSNAQSIIPKAASGQSRSPPIAITSDPIFEDLPTFSEKQKRCFRRSIRAPSPPASDDARVSVADMSQQLRNSKLAPQQHSQARGMKRFSKLLSPFRCLVSRPRENHDAPQSSTGRMGQRNSAQSDPVILSSAEGQRNGKGPPSPLDRSQPLDESHNMESQSIEITDDTRKIVRILTGEEDSGNSITGSAASKALDQMKHRDKKRQKERESREEARKEIQKDYIKLTMELNRRRRINQGYELAQAELKNEINETKALLVQAQEENKSLQFIKEDAEEAKSQKEKQRYSKHQQDQNISEDTRGQVDRLRKENVEMHEKLSSRSGLHEEELALRSEIAALARRIQEYQHQKHERKQKRVEMRNKVSTLKREKDEMTTELYSLKLYEKQLELKEIEDNGAELAAKAELDVVKQERDQALQDLDRAASDIERSASEAQKTASNRIVALQNEIESTNDQTFDVMGEIRKLRLHEANQELSQRKADIRAAYFPRDDDGNSPSTARVSSSKNKSSPFQDRASPPERRVGSLLSKSNISSYSSGRLKNSQQQVRSKNPRLKVLEKEVKESQQETQALEAQLSKTEEMLRRKSPKAERRIVHNTVYPPEATQREKASRQSNRHSKLFNKSLDRLIFSSSAHDLVVGQLVAV